ncbi:uncharacterized, partial [Tachysurus ichikawai]
MTTPTTSPLSRDQNRPCCFMSGAQECRPPASNICRAASCRKEREEPSHTPVTETGLFLSGR